MLLFGRKRFIYIFFLHSRINLHLFEKLSEETLENLAEVLDHLLEEKYPKEFDVSLSVSIVCLHVFTFLVVCHHATLFYLN